MAFIPASSSSKATGPAVLPPPIPQVASSAPHVKTRRDHRNGVGLIILGVLCVPGFPWGTAVGAVLIYFGARMSRGVHRCSECAEKVQSEAKVCPHCGARFEGTWVDVA